MGGGRGFGERTTVPLVASFPAELQVRHPIFDYDTLNRRVVFVQPPTSTTPIELWTWDPDTDEWESLPQSSPKPTSKRGMGRRVFVYVAAFNVFVCLERLRLYCDVPATVCGGETKTWLYRLKA